jgi:molybdate transport system substrate-binding protein
MTIVRVLSGGAAQGLVEALRPAFEATTGARIEGTFGAVGAMRDRLLAGEPADVMILSRALIDGLARDGQVLGLSAKNIGAVQTAVAVRSGDAMPAVGSAAELRKALLAADSIHFPDPEQSTAGIHFAKVLKDLGIWDEVANRRWPAPNGATAMRELAAATGSQAIGCTQATVYTCAISAKASSPTEAAELIALLANEAGRDTRGRLGFSNKSNH